MEHTQHTKFRPCPSAALARHLGHGPRSDDRPAVWGAHALHICLLGLGQGLRGPRAQKMACAAGQHTQSINAKKQIFSSCV